MVAVNLPTIVVRPVPDCPTTNINFLLKRLSLFEWVKCDERSVKCVAAIAEALS